MKLLQGKTQKLLAASIAHDGKIVLFARRRSGARMKDLLPANLAAVAKTRCRFVCHVEPGSDCLVSLELGCWRPLYPFAMSFYVGEHSDWPFGAGDLPQVGETAPNVDRHKLEFAFDPKARSLSWSNTKFSTGQLQLDDTNLVMAYLSIRVFSATTKPQASLEIVGGPTFGGERTFKV